MADLNETVDEIFGNGSITNTAIATPVTLTLGGFDSPGDFSGTISAGAAGTGGLNLVRTGTATQTFSGVLTYTGNTTINGGTLNLVTGTGPPQWPR